MMENLFYILILVVLIINIIISSSWLLSKLFPAKKSMPGRNVRDYGAVGDGIANDTVAIQRAIDAGGMVFFPKGTYRSGTLYLRSDGGLYLDAGAEISASSDRNDYRNESGSGSECDRAADTHLIVATGQKNIVIKGPGRIDGNRKAFWDPPEDWTRIWQVRPWQWRPGQMLYFKECENIRIQDVELLNSPYWTCFLHGCENVFVTGVRICNHPHTRNGDGLDIDCCRNVTVSNCIIESGDDCITLRAGERNLTKKQPCENITISNCILKTICNAVRIGVGNGTIRNAVFSNCIIHDSRMGISLCGRYRTTTTLLENIQFNNIYINARLPIVISGNTDPEKPVHNISFRHIKGTAASSIRVLGTPEAPVTDISFADMQFDWEDGGKPDPMDAPFGGNASQESPDGAVFLSYTRRISFENCRIDWKTMDPAWKFGLKTLNSTNITHDRCDFGKENINREISLEQYRLLLEISARQSLPAAKEAVSPQKIQ